MVDTPIHKRDFRVFLSYAHADRDKVDRLYDWLHNIAGIDTWYDARNLPPSARIVSYLPQAIGMLGVAHELAYSYRRRVMNYELS